MFIKTLAPQDHLISQLLPIMVQASQILLEEYQSYCAGCEFNIQEKSDDSPVTQADLKVNHFLLKQLATVTPQLPVLSEESDYSARAEWKSCWMLDPLDGTKEFIHERDEFTINLSLIENHETTFAIIAVPCEQLIYIGYTSQLPYKYSISRDEWYKYQIEEHALEAPIQIGLSHNSKNPKYKNFIEPILHFREVERREAGSAYKFCMMLEGEIDIYPRFHPTSEWDTSSGQSLLESIGGGLMTLDGKPFQYNQRETVLNNGFIAFKDQYSKKIAYEALRDSGILD
ncbi:3'(2'),5'-bisphosphate nucleotidase CysQ [Acinetobacter sp. Z1]|uniref:3'(2'),5'-bisphosphate nucleotidase CysQ family protein n=1 Tax=Acinetobacter sp. Z1 TaxID=2953738 RepID=UPI0020C86DD4|nr:3'(2'),5'-bisphosphate nucleotidase CysQ [Acinetobacter sp. Z1]UTO18316.1 3'(2'),5'-bisphosphate nucleotidase CysQ [Acinetobacter sp. Z1]